MYQIKEVLNIVIKPKFKVFFTTNTSNSYQVIPMKKGDKYKVGVITLYSQYIYLWMRQGLKGSLYTYSQFTNLIFGYIPIGDIIYNSRSYRVGPFPTIIRDHSNWLFSLFIDNYIGGIMDYKNIFTILYKVYFPQIIFSPIYLSPGKTFLFIDSLNIVGFTRSTNRIRLLVKY